MPDPDDTARCVLITGGGQGIGKGCARYFLEHSWQVAIADYDREAGEETARELGGLGDIEFVACDVAEEADVRALMQRCAERFGDLAGVINNAGISCNKPLDALTLQEWNRVLSVNLTGTLLCSKYAAPALRRSRGAIVNVASTRALMSEAHTEAYSASKGGILALTHALAVSLGPEIRVNAISPGWIDVTPWQKSARRVPAHLSHADHAQHPAGRVGRPDDVAAMAYQLLGAEAGFITGQNFIVDGGMTRKMIYTA